MISNRVLKTIKSIEVPVMQIMRYVGQAGCEQALYGELLKSQAVNIIDPGPQGNVAIQFHRNGKLIRSANSRTVRDLFDLGICIYIADEIYDRDQGFDEWTRQFEFVMPVFEPDLWQQHEASLSKVLSHLSGDRFSFKWLKRGELTGYGKQRTGIPNGYNSLCLFSGGVDSLIGAYQLLEMGKKVLLCGHYAEGVSSKAQFELFEVLKGKYGDNVALIQCYIARTRSPSVEFALSEKQEETHRPRSFLFLTTAIAVARQAGIQHIYIPENGYIGLNAPLGVSRLGTLSTRTVHPRYLVDFMKLVRALGVYTGTLENPFLLMSKTDMLRNPPTDLLPLLKRSVSCAHTGAIRWTGSRGINHCGYCVPCLYRRIAFMEGGIDDPSDYYCDVFKDLAICTSTQQSDLRFLARFAQKFQNMNQLERQAITVSQGVFSAEECHLIYSQKIETLLPFADMMNRWTSDFLRKLNVIASQQTKNLLGL